MYVFFNTTELSNTIDLGSLQFDLVIYGIDKDDYAAGVALGDVNGDSIQDIIIGGHLGDGPKNERTDCGEIYIIYGNHDFPSEIDLKTTSPNLTIYGADSEDWFGCSITSEDINNDNFDDILMGAYGGDGPENNKDNAGEVYVIYGSDNLTSIIDFNQTEPEIKIFGIDSNDLMGITIITADIIDNNMVDLVIGAYGADYPSWDNDECGEVYIIRGRSSFPSVIDLNTTSPDVLIYSKDSSDYLGTSLAHGDINNDGKEDLLLSTLGDRDYFSWFNCGEVYVIFGRTSLPSNLYIVEEADVIIYGVEEADILVEVCSGDVNNDNYDDLIIGAVFADGPNNNRINCGEINIIYGKKSLPSVIDLNITSPDILIYGNNNDDNLGYNPLCGDINNRGQNDILISSWHGDGPDNLRNDCGELFLICNEAKDFIYSDSVILKNGNGLDKKTCYAKYKPYNFQVEVYDTKGYQDIKSVKLNLDYVNMNLQYVWNNYDNTFSKLYDPNDYTNIDSLSSIQLESQNKLIINFNITFDWTYPDENLHGIQVESISETLTSHWLNIPHNFYSVENDLNFNGTLLAKSEDKRYLSEGDWIKGGEKITWEGLKVFYEGTSEFYPPLTEYEVIVSDESGDQWTNDSKMNNEVIISSIITNKTNVNETFIINITGIPNECDKSDESFYLRVDGDNITFSNPEPDTNIWQNSINIQCKITVDDGEGSGVNISTLQYCKKLHNENGWTAWKPVTDFIQNNNEYICSVNISFIDGNNNYIKWQGKDNVGNGFTESDEIGIFVDTINVVFLNHIPEPSMTLSNNVVSCSITIIDYLTKVDAESIEYTIKKDGESNWTSWIPYNETHNNSTINCTVEIRFNYGLNNYIKWRAKDILGNGYNESGAYKIKIIEDFTNNNGQNVNGNNQNNKTEENGNVIDNVSNILLIYIAVVVAIIVVVIIVVLFLIIKKGKNEGDI